MAAHTGGGASPNEFQLRSLESPSEKPIPFLSVKIIDSSISTEQGIFGRKYVRYLLSSSYKPSRSEETLSVQVWRRYSEFNSFRSYLVDSYPAVIVPPVPEKKWAVDVQEVSQERLNTLEVFLERCIAHQVIGRSDALRYFLLETGFSDMATGLAVDFPLISSESSSITTKAQLAHARRSTMESARLMQLFVVHTENLVAVKKRQCNWLDQFSEGMMEWSVLDLDLTDALAIAGGQLSTCAGHDSTHWHSQLGLVTDFMREYILYSDTVRNVIERHVASPGGLKVKGSRGKLSTVGSYMLSSFKSSTNGENPVAATAQQKELDDESKAVLAEVSRLHLQQSRDFRDLWHEFLVQHIRYLRRTLAAWVKVKAEFHTVTLEPLDM